jgi:hypothetical protein
VHRLQVWVRLGRPHRVPELNTGKRAHCSWIRPKTRCADLGDAELLRSRSARAATLLVMCASTLLRSRAGTFLRTVQPGLLVQPALADFR